MKTYRELLNELGNSPYKWKWTKEHSEHIAKFNTEAGEYGVAFFHKRYSEVPKNRDNVPSTWSVVFYLDDKRKDGLSTHFDDTGTGDSIRVFSTVLAVLKDFIKKFNPHFIEFTADAKREKIYNKVLRYVKGYTLEKEKDPYDGEMKFTLTKK